MKRPVAIIPAAFDPQTVTGPNAPAVSDPQFHRRRPSQTRCVRSRELNKPRRADRAAAAKALEFLLDICEWTPITADTYRNALDSSFKDVNDAAIFFAASRPTTVVTRNTKDFRDHVNVEVLTAAEFVRKHLK